MTVARLDRELSGAEFDMWVALEMVKSEECPNCGGHPLDMMKLTSSPQRCPICKSEYGRIRRVGDFHSWKDSLSEE